MEVCIDSLESGLHAFEGGANRVEICSSLNEGGLTPSVGLFKSIKNHVRMTDNNFKLFCMIRPRVGDFLYNDHELECMVEDIKQFVELGADGLVFGCLTEDGLIDEVAIKELKKHVPNNIDTTCHRAFDMCSDWKESLKVISNLGFTRLLTSGQETAALKGIKRIQECMELVKTFNSNPVMIMPGCGINSENLETILTQTKCKEFHASCRSSKTSKMKYRNENLSMGIPGVDEFEIKYTDIDKVRTLVSIYKKYQQLI